MNLQNASSPALPDEAPIVANTDGSSFELQTFDIDLADQPLADEIRNFDPVFDTSGPTSIKGAVALPTGIKATGLPPHLRDPIIAKLANVPANDRDAEEARLVRAALYQNSLELRVAAGPGEGANAYQKAFFLLEFDRYEAQREIDRIGMLLGEVDENASVVTDPVTGQQKVETRHKIQGQRRQALEAEFSRALHRHAQLYGLEGERRLQRALYEAVAERKAATAQLDEQREAKELGARLAREERIRRMGEAYAKRERKAL